MRARIQWVDGLMEGVMKVKLDEDRARDVLGADIAAIFLDHAEVVPLEEAERMVPLVNVHLEAAHKIRTSMIPDVDVGLAEKLASACLGLLKVYPGMDDRSRAAVVGAVRYFMQASDANDDLSSGEGFKDDAQVINYVIEITGADLERVRIE